MKRQTNTTIIAALIGHTWERYDVALYGYFSALLAPIFFPSSGNLGILWSLGAFSAGYLMRPLGGIFFGHLGDKYGRKKAFSLSIFLVIIPTLTMGILPTYAQIGLAAPFVLILCRLLQGLCGGGEFSGAGIFIGEHIKQGHEGFGGGIICGTGLIGALIGTAFGAIATLPDIPTWGWRLPFILGAIMTFITYFIRRRMIETPVFQTAASFQKIYKAPLMMVFKHRMKNVICAIAIGGYAHSILYITTIYMNVLYTTNLHLSSHESFIINMGIMFLWVVLSPVSGFLADKVGIRKFMGRAALTTIVCAWPLFWFMTTYNTIHGYIIFQVIFTLIGVSFVAPVSSLFTSLFPVLERYSGVAFSISVGQALLGGTTPLIATFLTTYTEDMKSPAFFLMITGCIGYIGIKTFKAFNKHATREDMELPEAEPISIEI